VSVTTLQCPVDPTGEGDVCGGEIEIEWEIIHLPPQPTGHKTCINCGCTDDSPLKLQWCRDFEDDLGPHNWVEQWDDGSEDVELISLKTYCWHPLSKAQALEALNDEAAAQAEARFERA